LEKQQISIVLSWRSNKYQLYCLGEATNTNCIVLEKQQIPIVLSWRNNKYQLYCLGEATNTNYIVFGWTLLGLEASTLTITPQMQCLPCQESNYSAIWWREQVTSTGVWAQMSIFYKTNTQWIGVGSQNQHFTDKTCPLT
jgi:hypothetical protein